MRDESGRKDIYGQLMRKLFGMLLAISVTTSAAATEIGEEVKRALEQEKHIYVSTRRANGEWSEAAPIWFMYDGEAIYFTTSPSAHKAKRIRRGSPVRIHVGRKDGTELVGSATLVSDDATIERMGEAYRKKYWIAWFGFFRPRVGRVTSGKTIAVKVVPTSERGKTKPGT